MRIREFGVELWMNEFENNCELNLAETCVESLTVSELLELSGHGDELLQELLPMKLTYGAIEGSDRLRDNICGLYDGQQRENVIVTHGTIGANALVYQALVSPGDHVVSVLPTYQQHYSIPESIGAEVQILELREQNQFLPDLDELRSMVSTETAVIAINNPNNPTGALMHEALLLETAEIARRAGAYLLCDEVYRGTDQHGDGYTVSVVDLYEKGISTAGMSKAFSLAGLRLGWIAAPAEVIAAVAIHRDYNTISVGMIDDYFACVALECRDKIMARSQRIVRNNLGVLDAWVSEEPSISYVKPQSGTVALLKYDFEMASRDFCVGLLDATGVMLTPGSAMDMEGYLRIGYANRTEVLTAGLERISDYLRSGRRHGVGQT
jgi:aspartate/methionine/tyrosine aminotransferase